MSNFPNAIRSPLPEPTKESYRALSVFGADLDPAERLRPGPRLKVRRLRDAREEAAERARGPYTRMRALRGDLESVRARIDALTRRSVNPLDESHLSVVVEREAEKKLVDEIARLGRMHAERREDGEGIGRVVAAVDTYLTDNFAFVFEIAKNLPTPSVPKNSSIVTEIEKVRGQIQKLKDERQAIYDAPAPTSEALAIATGQIERIAEAGAIDVMPCVESGRPFLGPDGLPLGGATVLEPRELLSLIVWLNKDALLKRLESEILSKADDRSALTNSDRIARLRANAAAILAAERVEEALVELGEADGKTIPRRGECDPRAILGLADNSPVPEKF